jgi:hypothetical protein
MAAASACQGKSKCSSQTLIGSVQWRRGARSQAMGIRCSSTGARPSPPARPRAPWRAPSAPARGRTNTHLRTPIQAGVRGRKCQHCDCTVCMLGPSPCPGPSGGPCPPGTRPCSRAWAPWWPGIVTAARLRPSEVRHHQHNQYRRHHCQRTAILYSTRSIDVHCERPPTSSIAPSRLTSLPGADVGTSSLAAISVGAPSWVTSVLVDVGVWPAAAPSAPASCSYPASCRGTGTRHTTRHA